MPVILVYICLNILQMPSLPTKSTRLMVRLARYGCTNRPFYHIVVIPNRSPRNGRIIEQLGTYDPMPNMNNERLLSINFERLRKRIADGVFMSKPVEQLVGK